MSSLFVTGTDTDIGKTLVSAILARQMRYNYWKPVQTGTEISSDSDFVSNHIGLERIFPESYRFKRPLSPHHAAAMENSSISVDKILLDWERCPKPVVVEGAGGLLVPIVNHFKMLDLISALEIPTVLVARSGLGTINHSLLSVDCLRRRQIPIAGIVLSGPKNILNEETIREETNIPVLSLEQLDSVTDIGSNSQLLDLGELQL